jgi:hypothetical protein
MRARPFPIAVLLLVSHSAIAQPTIRGAQPVPPPAAGAGAGSFYALVIGINRYQHQPALQTAVNDARAVDAVLRGRYGFHTRLLVDEEATSVNIVDAFSAYRRTLKPDDSLLVYYAGHGQFDKEANKAYWLPVDARPDSPANWIIADVITAAVRVLPARHVLIVSDSCYSGDLTREAVANNRPARYDSYIQKMLAGRSRSLISSGGNEPVADSGAGGHSVFANAVLNGLTKMDRPVFTATDLFDSFIIRPVAGGSAQVPHHNMIRDSGDEDGDFVFVAAGGTAPRPLAPTPAPTPPPAPPDDKSGRPQSGTATTSHTLRPASFDPAGAVPLTPYRECLLIFRDLPEIATDRLMAEMTKWQIWGETSVWNLMEGAVSRNQVPSSDHLNQRRPTFVYEWQKIISENPAFARNTLLPLFLRSDGDWSFLAREKDWDSQADAYVFVFLFAREKYQGRDVEFVAHELAPFMKSHLQLAAAQAPTRLWFEVPVLSQYDFGNSTLRFRKTGANDTAAVELLDPFVKGAVFERPAKPDRNSPPYLPARARTTFNYQLSLNSAGIQLPDLPPFTPGIPVTFQNETFNPLDRWRSAIHGYASIGPFPDMGALAIDRRLTIESVPLDSKRAEALHITTQSLRARVYFDADHVEPGEHIAYNRPFGTLFARLQKVDILTSRGELVASLAAQGFPAAAGH